MMNDTGFEWGTSYQLHDSNTPNNGYGLKIQQSKREPQPQRYAPDAEHPCGAIAQMEYSDGRMPPRCILDASHEGWHATEPAPPPYDKYPAMQWAPS